MRTDHGAPIERSLAQARVCLVDALEREALHVRANLPLASELEHLHQLDRRSQKRMLSVASTGTAPDV